MPSKIPPIAPPDFRDRLYSADSKRIASHEKYARTSGRLRLPPASSMPATVLIEKGPPLSWSFCGASLNSYYFTTPAFFSSRLSHAENGKPD